MVAMIGSAIFIRMNWMFKAVLNIIAFVVYAIVIAYTSHCLYDNYDLNVYGICSSCESRPQEKWTGIVSLFVVLLATIILGRSVSCGECVGGMCESMWVGGMCELCVWDV